MNHENITMLENQESFLLEEKNLEQTENVQEFISTFMEELKDALQKCRENHFDKMGDQEERGMEKKLELEEGYYTIDRFEEEMAVLENRQTRKMIDIPKDMIPKEAKEGQILKWENNKFEIDLEKTNQVKNKIKEKYNHLWE